MYNPSCSAYVNLKSASYLSQYNRTKWDELITTINLKPGVDITPELTTRYSESVTGVISGYAEIAKMHNDANFNKAAMKWTNYYPGVHFDSSVVDTLARYVRVGVHRAWISRVDPGFFAPLHWDVEDNEAEFLKMGEIHRFSCFMNESSLGQIFILGEDHLFNQRQGTLIKWNNYKEWHTGINGSMASKYMLHIVGYRS